MSANRFRLDGLQELKSERGLNDDDLARVDGGAQLGERDYRGAAPARSGRTITAETI